MSIKERNIIALRDRIYKYENWISSGCKGKIPADIQKELLKLFSEDPHAYTYYRNSLFKLISKIDGDLTYLNEFIDFLNLTKFDKAHSEIINHYTRPNFVNRFDDKRINIIEIEFENYNEEISQVACFLYQSYYEIENVLLVLATFAILNTDKKKDVDLINLRDKSGNLKKGVCIDFIKSRLREYPNVSSLFSLAYNTKLRNTIGHNNYRIKNNIIESLDRSIRITKQEFLESLYSLQKINNFLVYYFSSLSFDLKPLRECGVLAVGFTLDDDPILFIFQLFCFYDIDSDKSWLNKIEFNFQDKILFTKISSRTPMKGKVDDVLLSWFKQLKKLKTVNCILQPIMPPIDENSELIEIDCGKFQKCNQNSHLDLKFRIKNQYVP